MGPQCRRKDRKGEREGEEGDALKIYLYMLKKMLIWSMKNRGDFGDSL